MTEDSFENNYPSGTLRTINRSGREENLSVNQTLFANL